MNFILPLLCPSRSPQRSAVTIYLAIDFVDFNGYFYLIILSIFRQALPFFIGLLSANGLSRSFYLLIYLFSYLVIILTEFGANYLNSLNSLSIF